MSDLLIRNFDTPKPGKYTAALQIYEDGAAVLEVMEKERKQRKQNAPCSEWISVDERMPALDTEVLVFAVGLPEWGFEGKTTMAIAHRFIYRFWSGGKEYEQWSTPWEYFHKDYKITHWMPLPEPPEEGGGD